jgi:hypothetical protein
LLPIVKEYQAINAMRERGSAILIAQMTDAHFAIIGGLFAGNAAVNAAHKLHERFAQQQRGG